MSETKFTPGPWSDVAGTTTGRAVVALGQPKVRFNVAACGGPNRNANARLIAAAPDLYEALNLHLAYEATPTDRGGSTGPKGRALSAWIKARDAALAKASAQTP